MAEITRTAIDQYQRDIRFRRLVQSAVDESVAAHNPPSSPHAEEHIYRIATDACIILLSRIYAEDGELAAQKMIAEHYKKIAEDALSVTLRPQIILGNGVER